jgi:hypothetical protein
MVCPIPCFQGRNFARRRNIATIVGAIQSHRQLAWSKRRDPDSWFANVDGAISSRSISRKEFRYTCSEDQFGRVFLECNSAIHVCSGLGRHNSESQPDEDLCRRINGPRMSVLLNNVRELFLRRDDSFRADVPCQIPWLSSMLTCRLSADLADCSPTT